jgi:hypothetical protein
MDLENKLVMLGGIEMGREPLDLSKNKKPINLVSAIDNHSAGIINLLSVKKYCCWNNLTAPLQLKSSLIGPMLIKSSDGAIGKSRF